MVLPLFPLLPHNTVIAVIAVIAVIEVKQLGRGLGSWCSVNWRTTARVGRAEVADGAPQVGRHRDTPVDSAMTSTTPWLVGKQNTCTSRPCRCSVTKGHRVRGPYCASMCVGGVAVAVHPSGYPGPQQGGTQPAGVTPGDHVEGHGALLGSGRGGGHDVLHYEVAVNRGIRGIRGFSDGCGVRWSEGRSSNRSGRSAGPCACPSRQELKAWPAMAS